MAATSSPLFSLSDVSAAFDPKLASLFSAIPKSSAKQPSHRSAAASSSRTTTSAQSSETSSETDTSDESSQSHDSGPSLDTPPPPISARGKAENNALSSRSEQQHSRKRKRQDDDLESRYLQKIAQEEAKEAEQKQAERATRKRNHTNAGADQRSDKPDAQDEESFDEIPDPDLDDQIPLHESLSKPEDDLELQKASRTVFLANVSTAAMTSNASKRQLLNHLTSIFPASAGSDPSPKIDSLRFRSTAYSNALPKKAAFARKDLMEATTKSTNAYAVYSTSQAAREAAKQLNGTVVLGRHLRVDQVAHPAKIDHHRCVFVGNLGFVDDESQIEANKDGEGKKKKPQKGDVEEGLWQQFAKAGKVESVRVVRDPKTRVGKGFAYVQFSDENSVEKALLYNDKKFPPLLPRKLRVVRAKKVRRDGSTGSKSGASSSQRGPPPSKPKAPGTANQQTLRGRVKKLLGRAGAAQMRQASNGSKINHKGGNDDVKPPEAFVFEGHRASSTQGNRGLKLGGSHRKKGGKPKTRSAKRAAAWKAQGGTKRAAK